MSLSKYSETCAYLQFLLTSLFQMPIFTAWNEQCDMTTSATRTTVLFCFLSVWVTPGCEEPSAFVTANQTKWGGGREDCSRCVLWGFFRSASNLYATRVMGIPRETIPLVSETMQNATLIPTDFSVKCSASQAIELGAQSLVFQHPRPRVQNHPQTLSRDFFSLQLTGSHCHRRSWHNEPNQTTKILQVSLPPLLSRTMNTGYSQRWLCVDTCSREKKERHLDGRERRRRCFLSSSLRFDEVDTACGETLHLS